MRRRIDLIRAYVEPWVYWFNVGAIVPIVLLTFWLWWPDERGIRYAGLVLQLLGIGTVWLGIYLTLKRFGHSMADWFRRRTSEGQLRAVEATDTVLILGTGNISVVGHDLDISTTPEQRIEVINKKLEGFMKEMTAFQSKTDESTRRQDEAIEHERLARDSAVQGMHKLIEMIQTDGLRIPAIGAFWIFIGVILGTIPGEIAGLLSG